MLTEFEESKTEENVTARRIIDMRSGTFYFELRTHAV